MKTHAAGLVLVALALASTSVEAQTRRDPVPNGSSVFGIAGPEKKAGDHRNGRKRVIYDRNGQRDYRRDFGANRREQAKRLECQIRPADNSCIGFRF